MERFSSGTPEQEDEMEHHFYAQGSGPDPTRRLDRDPTATALLIVDSGHWGTVRLDGVELFSVYLDGDSIEGKRSPDAEKRLGVLQAMVGCWDWCRAQGYPENGGTPVPIVRTYRNAGGSDAD